MATVLVDLQSGNLHSAEKAFQRMAAEAGGSPVVVTDDPDTVARADRVVLPGDGAFPACRAALDARDGLAEALAEAVRTRGRPFLGICIGMQLLATRGLEFHDTAGLDWIAGAVRPITPADPALKVPHMGWNDLTTTATHPVTDGIAKGDHAYFVHSYRFDVADPHDLLAFCDHGGEITAIVARGTVAGVQFHPEKSQATGLRLIANFLAWRP